MEIGACISHCNIGKNLWQTKEAMKFHILDAKYYFTKSYTQPSNEKGLMYVIYGRIKKDLLKPY